MTMAADYVRPHAIVTTAWTANPLRDPSARIVEVDVNTTVYQKKHIADAIAWNWSTLLCNTVVRDTIPSEKFTPQVVRPEVSARLCVKPTQEYQQ